MAETLSYSHLPQDVSCLNYRQNLVNHDWILSMELTQSVNANLANRDVPLQDSAKVLSLESFEANRRIAIIGDEPEALLLSVLYAEAGLPNILVGQFREWTQGQSHLSGVDEALWLYQVHKKAGRISLENDPSKIPFSKIQVLMIAASPRTSEHSHRFETTIRSVAPHISEGTQVVFAGLCKPHYTSSILKPTLEKFSGMKVGIDLGLNYIPLHWTGERVAQFREKPEVIANFEDPLSSRFQEHLLEIFPALSKASNVQSAEAAGLFAEVTREVTSALKLDLAKTSESLDLDFDEVLGLCSRLGTTFGREPRLLPGRESLGTSIALSRTSRREGSRLALAAHRVNEDYQSQVMDMIKRALGKCGVRLRRSRITFLGTDGLVRNPWSRPEIPRVIETLQKRGARITLYTGEVGGGSWTSVLSGYAQVETNLWRAVSKATCTVVALPRAMTLDLDPNLLANEMNRPGVVCDLSQVLEASNVERSGLFYTSIGRGTLDT